MTSFLNFLGNHYIIFIILALISIFALVGYFVNQKTKAHEEVKFEKVEEPDFSNIEVDNKGASLNEMLHQKQGTEGLPNEQPASPDLYNVNKNVSVDNNLYNVNNQNMDNVNQTLQDLYNINNTNVVNQNETVNNDLYSINQNTSDEQQNNNGIDTL